MYVCISGVCKVHVLHKCDFMNFSWWCFPSCCISGYMSLLDYQIIATQTTAVFNQQVKLWNVTKVTQGKPQTWDKICTWAWCPSIGKSKDALQRFLLQTMVSNTLKDLKKTNEQGDVKLFWKCTYISVLMLIKLPFWYLPPLWM